MKKKTKLNLLTVFFVLFSILLPLVYFQIDDDVFDVVVIFLELLFTGFAIYTFYFSKKLIDEKTHVIRNRFKMLGIRAVITLFYVLNISITLLIAAFGV